MKKITLLLLFFMTIPVMAQELYDDLLLRYPFDGNMVDISGNGFDATPFGVTYGEDRFGITQKACYFNGIDNYVIFPNVENLKVPLPVSFCFWVKYESSSFNQQVIFNTSFENNHEAVSELETVFLCFLF